MGTQGVLADITEKDLREAIIECKGVMKKVARKLQVGHACAYRYLNKYPMLKPILEEYRHGLREEDLDEAEDVLRYAMKECKESDLTNALKACMFFLNNRGKERGFSAPEMQNKEAVVQSQEMMKTMIDAFRSSSQEQKQDRPQDKAQQEDHSQ